MKRLFGALAATLLAMPAQPTIRQAVRPFAPGPSRARAHRRGRTRAACKRRGGNLAAATAACSLRSVMRSAPDGRTSCSRGGAFAYHASSHSRLRALKSFAPVARIGAAPTLFIVKGDSPIKTLGELVAKAKGGTKMSYGSAGPGTTMHIAAEQLNASAGTKITHVPYRGIAPALNDIVGGHIDFLNGDITVLYPQVKGGALRALAVAGTQRSALLPDVPTAQELGYKDVYMENWYGALVPAATPPDVVGKLEAAIMDALKNPEIWAKISANGVYGPQDAKAFRAQIERDIPYWNAEIKKLGITAE